MLLPPEDAADFIAAHQELIMLVSQTTPQDTESWAKGRDVLHARWKEFQDNEQVTSNLLYPALPLAVTGRFCYLKRYQKYYAMRHLEINVFYAVHALTTPLEEYIPEFSVVEACLLPFRDRIVLDGFIYGGRIHLGTNMMKETRTAFQAAKRNGTLITEIPASPDEVGTETVLDNTPNGQTPKPPSPSPRAQRLNKLSKKELVAFLDQSAERDEHFAQIVDLFLERGQPSKLASKLRRMIDRLADPVDFIDYFASSGVANELDEILDIIERDLLTAEPLAAMKTLHYFIETDGDILNHADDSNGVIGGTYHRACALLGQASLAAGKPPEAAEIFFDLHGGDDYGTRDLLYEQVAYLFQPEALQQLIADWREQAKKESEDDYGGVRVRLAQIGESIGDPELHEEASLRGRPLEDFPLVALDVAKVYLACGKPEIALTKVPPAEAFRFHDDKRSELLIEIQQALGNQEAIAAEYEKLLAVRPSASLARSYLDVLPADKRDEADRKLRAQVLAGSYDPTTKAFFFAKLEDLATAADIIEQSHERFKDVYYSLLLDLAELLGDAYPLAVSILYRANLDSILGRAQSRYYHHAVRYAHQLADLASHITDWKHVTPHVTYWLTVQKQHKRKHSFWRKYEEQA